MGGLDRRVSDFSTVNHTYKQGVLDCFTIMGGLHGGRTTAFKSKIMFSF
jgi:hypothetical protein